MASPYEHERTNAFRILSSHLKGMVGVDMDTVASIHGALDAGRDLEAQAQVSIKKAKSFMEKGWNKTRDWFIDLVDAVCAPLGLATGYCPVGNVLHNGRCIAGSLGAALTAGVIIARIADDATSLARGKYSHLSDAYAQKQENAFCAGFIQEMALEFKAGEADMSEGAKRMRVFAKSCEVVFGWTSDWEPSTPTKSDRDHSAAVEGQRSAEKRKRDYQDAVNAFQKQKIRALTFGC